MVLSEYFHVYDKLSDEDKVLLERVAVMRTATKGTLLHGGAPDCMGLLVLKSGQLRAYITSDEGREITMYRLFEHDICLFSASCMMRSIQFDICISAEKDTEFWIIPPDFYKRLMERNIAVSNYTNEIMAMRLTDIMWLVEQIMWKSFDKRLADFLIKESEIEDSKSLTITHEKIANHMGTAREVVTRMLKYFQTEGMVKLTRGVIEIVDEDRLYELNS